MKTGKLGIDVGGTFTDFVLARAGEPPHIHKTLSTPADPSMLIRGANWPWACLRSNSIASLFICAWTISGFDWTATRTASASEPRSR